MGKKHKKDGGKGPSSGAAPLAAMAAMALKQANSPAGRQMLATGLRAAADALAPRARAATMARTEAPAANDAPPRTDAARPDAPPRQETPPRPEMPPEVARVIGTVAAGLERWAAKVGTPKG